MAKFTSFDAPRGTAGPISVRRASADDFGGDGKSLQIAGAALADFGKVIKEREDKRSITSARAQFSEFQLQFEQEQAQRQQDAPIGSTGHFDASKSAFDDSYNKMSSGWNDVQKNAMSGLVATARTSNLTGAIRFQAQNIVKGDLRDIGVIQKGIGAQMYNGTVNLKGGMKLLDEALVDTTIGAEGQQALLTKALPAFRKQILDGLLQKPDVAMSKLQKGELSGFPPEEIMKFRDDLVTRIKDAEETGAKRRFAVEVTTNAEAYDIMTKGGTLADLANVEGLSVEAHDQLKAMIIKRNRPVRTIEEKQDASADLLASYAELGVTVKNGKRKTSSSIEDLLRFQTDTIKRVNEGFLTEGEARRVIRNVEEIVQGRIGSEDTGVLGIPFIDIIDDNPFNVGNEAIIKHVNDNNLGKKDHVGIARIFNARLDEAGISPDSDQDESRDQKVRKMVEDSIKEYVQKKHPATRNMKDVPNAVIGGGKVSAGAQGQRDLPGAKKVAGGTSVQKDKNGNYARVTRNEAGKVTNVEEITPEQAVPSSILPPPDLEPNPPNTPRLPPPDLEPNPPRLPPPDLEPGEEQTEPEKATLPPPDLEPDPSDGMAAGETDEEFQQRMADEVTQAFDGIETEDAPPDLDPAPDRALVKLPISPAEQAIDIVQGGLLGHEGTGDTLTGIATGEGGITEARKTEIEQRKGRPLTDEQARNEAVREDSAALHNGMAGFGTLNPKVQAAVIDLAFNIGVNNVLDPSEFPRLQRAVAQGDAEAVLGETLNTATVAGRSVKGLAMRRARMFNKASRDFRITAVEQLGDGTINYMSGNEVLFTFKRPRHSDSRAGTTQVASG